MSGFPVSVVVALTAEDAAFLDFWTWDSLFVGKVEFFFLCFCFCFRVIGEDDEAVLF